MICRSGKATVYETGATDPEAQDLLGQVEAILMKYEEARAAFAQARKLDPYFTPALEHEVALLLRSEQKPAALDLLEAELTTLSAANAKDSKRGPAAMASGAPTPRPSAREGIRNPSQAPSRSGR